MVKGDKLPGRFARKLKEWRAQKTRAELDEALKVHELSSGYTALLENNRIKPPGKAVCETIAKVLGVEPPDDVWNLAMEERLVAFDPELAEWVEGRYEAGVKAEQARVSKLQSRYQEHFHSERLGQPRLAEIDLVWKLRELEQRSENKGVTRALWTFLDAPEAIAVLRALVASSDVHASPTSEPPGRRLLAALAAVSRAVAPLAVDDPNLLRRASGDPDGFSDLGNDEIASDPGALGEASPSEPPRPEKRASEPAPPSRALSKSRRTREAKEDQS